MNKSSRIVTLTVTAVIVAVVFVAIWVVRPTTVTATIDSARMGQSALVTTESSEQVTVEEVKNALLNDKEFLEAISSGVTEDEVYAVVNETIKESDLATTKEVEAIISAAVDEIINQINAMLPLTEAYVVTAPDFSAVEPVSEADYQTKRAQERSAAIQSILSALQD